MTLMPNLTDLTVIPSPSLGSNSASRFPSMRGEYRPVEKNLGETFQSVLELSGAKAVTADYALKKKFAPPQARSFSHASADSIPIQIWEGTVIEVDHASKSMKVTLDAKMGQIPRHTGEIDLEWVAEQDEDLLLPGGVFYLTLFKRTKRGSIENSQELRFRRRPSWSAEQMQQLNNGAEMVRSKMKQPPQATSE